MIAKEQSIFISAQQQKLFCYENKTLIKTYIISTAKNGLGEVMGSECTPRGLHQIYSRIGLFTPLNSVFVTRKWTGEIYSPDLAIKFPERDWILTRILQLDGLEEGRNKGGQVDSLKRCIYIHGTPEVHRLGEPVSHGCIRMENNNLVELVDWVSLGTVVLIE